MRSSLSNNPKTIATTLSSKWTDHQQKVLESVALWAGYYRWNVDIFVRDFLHIELHLFQKVLLVMMNFCSIFVFVACRGIGKTFLSAIYCVVRCVLYPGEKVCIVSGTRGQAMLVLEKIMTELVPNSPELAYEIDEKATHSKGPDAIIMFKNTSFIKVVTSNDNSRGNRAHILIIDEFRMVDKETISTVLKKFLSTPRRPPFMKLPEYKNDKSLQEPLQTLYLSSAYYKDHWSFTKCIDTCKMMLNDKHKAFVCGFPYQLSLAEGLLTEERVIEDITESDFNEIKWSMEMEAEFWGDSEGSFFNFEAISKNRKLQYPMLPSRLSVYLPDAKLRIPPKQPGEKRIMSVDIALMASVKHNNDATAIFINQLMPTKALRYSSHIVYGETVEGEHTEDQALRIRRLQEDYQCDYITLDCQTVGMGVYDTLVRDITDPETGEIYPALSCCNNPALAARCKDSSAAKVIWAINGSARFNSNCAILLRDAFISGRIRLLATEYDGEKYLSSIKGFSSLSESDKAKLMMPYINTTLLIGELIGLKHEDSGGLIKLSEKTGARKDRYSSLSYNFWLACELEKNLRHKDEITAMSSDTFLFRAPKLKARR